MDALPTELYAVLYRFSDMETFKSLSLVSRGLRADCQRLIFVRRAVFVSARSPWEDGTVSQADYIRQECQILDMISSSGGSGILGQLRHLIIACHTEVDQRNDEDDNDDETDTLKQALAAMFEISGAVTRALTFRHLNRVSFCIEAYLEEPAELFNGLAKHIFA
jgi:hypothetical protein